MAALSEKILWPIVGIFIFGVLAGFYIDDRRRLTEEGADPNQQQASSNEHGGKAADHKQANSEHAGKAAKKTPSSATTKQAASSNSAGATSMDINEYLAQSSNQRSTELEANVTHHQGFSGSIDEYLSGSQAKVTKNMQSKTDNANSNSKQANGASSMSMEEYQAKNSGSSSVKQQNSNFNAYHGGIDDYLAKYGGDTQTPAKKQSSDPFNEKEHMGFHGSYEEYAKKYN
ncbi:MAG: hypothetical protein GKR92_11405 [Gammaproteobacteria bacterium]|nr:MAG: hypothetical protein GKR92_11405 [Gammaproteobacteria bacterium]